MALHPAMWRRRDVPDGLAHGALSDFAPDPENPDAAFLLDGAAVVRDEHGPWSIRFSVITDARWHTRSTFVEVLGADGLERLTLAADALGVWTLDGRPWPELEGCTDVDISASPMTNTMPIRRGELAVGEELRLEAVWIDVPSLSVHRVPQVYRRLPDQDGLATYAYADPTYGPYTMTVDHVGLVVDYQSLFTRVR